MQSWEWSQKLASGFQLPEMPTRRFYSWWKDFPFSINLVKGKGEDFQHRGPRFDTAWPTIAAFDPYWISGSINPEELGSFHFSYLFLCLGSKINLQHKRSKQAFAVKYQGIKTTEPPTVNFFPLIYYTHYQEYLQDKDLFVTSTVISLIFFF